ncbi:hypothetical protein [uncultured Draconibacterium sp.]|uniref:hypothetical protein n=1 Tax=uncultured Draconibacterium sp. TaxID=1573823 RepID=UPI003260A858
MKKILPKSNLARTLLLGLVFLFHGVFSSFGQIPTTGQTIEFKNGTPSSGFNYSVGDYYTYTNILPSSGVNIYATVTIVEKNRVDSWSNFDQEGYPNDAQKRNERFQPVINFNTDGYVKFEVDFFESTTDLPVYLNDFNFIGVDIDGDAYYSSNSDRTYGFTEYMQITGYSTYDVQTPTDLTVVESGITLDVIGYYGSYTDGGGSVVVNPEGSFSATYTDAVASFEFIIGIKSFRNSNQYGNNPGSRYFSASIGPNIIQYNFPTPIAADDNNSDVCFPITADTEVLNAYSNDTYRGHDITLGDTIVTNVIQANINLIFNTDNGSVSVKAGTPIGTYILKYQLSTKPGDIPNYGPVKESRIATVTVVVKDCCTQTVSASATDSALCESENLELFATTIDGGSYSWNKDGGSEFSSDQNPIINNVTTADAGLYIVEVTYNGGSCVALDTVSITVYPTYTAVENTAVDTAVCEADMPFNYEGTEFTAAGSKDITFQTVNGCDSIVTVNLTVYPTYTAVENTAVDTAVCEADMPFNYEGTEFTAAGSKDITFQTVNGCDSIVTVNLTVYPTYTAVENTTVDTAVCEADMPFNYEGTEFTAAGSKDITFQTVNGCDSIVTVNLTVYPTYTAVENTAVDTAVCEADMPFNYEGTEFTAAGSKDITFQTVNGCDSIVTVNLTVYPTYTAVENTAVDTAVCEADMPFNYEGTEFTAAGSKDITFQTVNGCDSIVATVL